MVERSGQAVRVLDYRSQGPGLETWWSGAVVQYWFDCRVETWVASFNFFPLANLLEIFNPVQLGLKQFLPTARETHGTLVPYVYVAMLMYYLLITYY